MSSAENDNSLEEVKNNEEGDNLKLIETKNARKQAEENALKLENRVKLLEKEKMRVMKKIE
jgi:hypothetical protein